MPLNHTERERLSRLWNFNWPVMDVLIGGDSSIDLPRLDFLNADSARNFLASYGYNVDEAADRRKLHAIFIEAVLFIERFLMPQEWQVGLRPPAELLTNPDPVRLLLHASAADDARDDLAKWSCAILRVMHTIAHIEGFWRVIGLETARKSIQQRFTKHMETRADQRLYLGSGDEAVELVQLDWKDGKSRESIILKLLHKRGNVAETIYDLLGVRIVTKHLSDVMLVVKCLQAYHIVTFPNCNPARSRNTLIDADKFKDGIVMLNDMISTGKLTQQEFLHLLDRASVPAVSEKTRKTESVSANPHTGHNYRSIQLTCRYLVNMPNPTMGWARKLDEMTGSTFSPEKVAVVNELKDWLLQWHTLQDEQDVRVFVPFEIQIMDQQAYSDNKAGDAAHDRYKASQIRTARRRVLAEILQ